MGGIGKTTLAKDLYAKLCSQFERHCFLENVREESSRYGLNVVRNKLFSTLLELRLDATYVETPIFMRRLACEKSFIVLDDVATLEQAENLNINNNCLGPGSRVIVTTRDKQVCSEFDECEIYEVKELDEYESLQLFCLNAFGEKRPKVGYEKLSESAIGYCRGNPLALKVLGTNFRTKSKQAWESELEKLKKIPNRRIHDVLKLSFDDLDHTQQDIFLDIACFFSMMHQWYEDRDTCRDDLICLLDACNFFAASGIEVLINKALITCKDFNCIDIHNLLQEMGQEIVKQESPKNPGRRSRLYDPEEIYDLLKYNKGTEVVEAMVFDSYKVENLHLSSDSFKGMTNLRYLQIRNTCFERKSSNVYLPDGLGWLSDKLRYLSWDVFPLESLPSTFCFERLVQLIMCKSKLKKLWDGIQKLDNLKFIMLNDSKDLVEVPDLSGAPNIEVVSLSYCESLCQLHPSILNAPKLGELHLNGCINLESLKTTTHSKSLYKIDLTGCSSLIEFSVTSDEMVWLSLSGTAIHELASSIWHNSKLTHLFLRKCQKLNIVGKKLSNDPGVMPLKKLDLSGCTQIDTLNLWHILDGLQYLKHLHLKECCNIEALPDNIQEKSMMENLILDECKKLKSLPKLPASLQKLTAINSTYLNTDSIQQTMLENMLHKLHTKSIQDRSNDFYEISFIPGGQVPREFDFHTTETSIVIPPIPKFGLSAFIFCIILSEGLNVSYNGVYCTIYERGKQVQKCYVGGRVTLISDHVMLSCQYVNDELVELGSESGDDHYNLSFEFKYYVDEDDGEFWSTKGIKGCGIFPVYDLKLRLELDGRIIGRDEIVELQSSAQSYNTEKLESKLEALMMKMTNNKENEDDKSSFECSIGLLLKDMLEESKLYFSSKMTTYCNFHSTVSLDAVD
uniref:NBS-LRR protein n=1 Tax=Cicer arietinum TaxID=3827 RepID=W0M163_CICAR|nr:NBS-LRR protein [Cicer arietinum]